MKLYLVLNKELKYGNKNKYYKKIIFNIKKSENYILIF